MKTFWPTEEKKQNLEMCTSCFWSDDPKMSELKWMELVQKVKDDDDDENKERERE